MWATYTVTGATSSKAISSSGPGSEVSISQEHLEMTQEEMVGRKSVWRPSKIRSEGPYDKHVETPLCGHGHSGMWMRSTDVSDLALSHGGQGSYKRSGSGKEHGERKILKWAGKRSYTFFHQRKIMVTGWWRKVKCHESPSASWGQLWSLRTNRPGSPSRMMQKMHGQCEEGWERSQPWEEWMSACGPNQMKRKKRRSTSSKKERIQQILKEEAQHLIEDDPEIANDEIKIIHKLKKMMQNPSGQEEVLQTKIISPSGKRLGEMVRSCGCWGQLTDAREGSTEEADPRRTSRDQKKGRRGRPKNRIPSDQGRLHREAHPWSIQTQGEVGRVWKPGTKEGRWTDIQWRSRRHSTQSAHLGICEIRMEGMRLGHQNRVFEPPVWNKIQKKTFCFFVHPPSSSKKVI